MRSPNIFNSARVSNSIGPSGGVRPIKKGTVALDLDLDMKKFKTWSKFNEEFEKRLDKKERANILSLKK